MADERVSEECGVGAEDFGLGAAVEVLDGVSRRMEGLSDVVRGAADAGLDVLSDLWGGEGARGSAWRPAGAAMSERLAGWTDEAVREIRTAKMEAWRGVVGMVRAAVEMEAAAGSDPWDEVRWEVAAWLYEDTEAPVALVAEIIDPAHPPHVTVVAQRLHEHGVTRRTSACPDCGRELKAWVTRVGGAQVEVCWPCLEKRQKEVAAHTAGSGDHELVDGQHSEFACSACLAERNEQRARRSAAGRQAGGSTDWPGPGTAEQVQAMSMAEMPYGEYLKTDWWRAVRKAALARAAWKCALCNSADGLNVHHSTYERRGRELESDVVVLCAWCHERFHDAVGGAVRRGPPVAPADVQHPPAERESGGLDPRYTGLDDMDMDDAGMDDAGMDDAGMGVDDV
ncbi:MAG: hypothetical protein GY901_04465 [Actinomycetia bacterium]|nr:hypothetical protein [Actinomycetes bacterium]